MHPKHTLHADLLDVPKTGPFRSIMLGLDEYSRSAFPRLLETRDQDADVLLSIIKRARVLHSHHIMYITVLKEATSPVLY
jgi:hypothetical protein